MNRNTAPGGDEGGAGIGGDDKSGSASSTSGEGQGTSGKNDDAGEKKFTQADIDRIVQERLARSKTQPPANVDDQIAQAVEAQLAEHTAKANQGLIRAEIKALAAQLGFIDSAIAPVILGADKSIDLTKIDVVDGQPDSEALKKHLEKLASERPYLIGTAVIPGAGAAGSGGSDSDDSLSPRELLRRGVEKSSKKTN